jgi:hypothetical protein
MAWRIVLQPNGKLARFSDVVDNFTDVEMTVEEAIIECQQELSLDAAKKKVQVGVDDLIPMSVTKKGDGSVRWNDCLQTISLVHGNAEVREVLAFCHIELPTAYQA